MNPKEAQILEAAAVLFARFGLRKTTIDEIARAAHIAKGTVYLYFKSKEEIFKAVVSLEINRLIASMEAAVAQTPDALAQLERFLDVRFAFHDEMTSRFNLTREVVFEAQLFFESQSLKHDYLRHEQRILCEILHLGNRQGVFAVHDPVRTALSLSLVLFGLDQGCQPFGEWLQKESKTELFLELVLNGICKKDKTPEKKL